MRKLLAVLGLAASLLLVGGIAVASIPDSSGVIHGCRKNTDGSLKVIDSDLGQTCANGYTALNWSQTGPQGPAGPTGPQGPAGPAGVSGYVQVEGPPVRLNQSVDGGSATAFCPTGKKPLGGGWTVLGSPSVPPTVSVQTNSPNQDAITGAQGWYVFMRAPTDDITFYVHVICATVT